MDGSLLANGRNATGSVGGGGSGGSIYVVCRRFRGGGAIEAPGGDGASVSPSGGGGGGRIAVWRMYHESTVSTDVTAGSGNGVAAEAGTMVWGWFPVPGTVFTIH